MEEMYESMKECLKKEKREAFDEKYGKIVME